MSSEPPVARTHIEIAASAGGIASGMEAAKQQVVGGMGAIANAAGGVSLGAFGLFAGLAAGMASFASGAMEAEQNSARFGFMMEQISTRVGISTDGLREMAGSMATLTNQSGGAAQSVMSTMGMFEQIRGENFQLATQYALQFATAGLASVEGAAHTLGIALESPERGMRMLRQMNITFSQEQQHVIRQMSQMGDIAGAQGVILQRVGNLLPGMAAAMSGTVTAQIAALERNVKSVGKAIGAAILPVLGAVVSATNGAVNLMKEAWGGMAEPIKEVAKIAAMVGGLFIGWGVVSPMLSTIGALLAPVGTAIASITWPVALGIAAVVAFGAALVAAFQDQGNLGTQMRESLTAVWEIIQKVGQTFTNVFQGADVSGLWQSMKEAAGSVWLAISGWIEDNAETFMEWAHSIGRIMIGVVDIGKQFLVGLGQMFNFLLEASSGVWQAIAGGAGSAWGSISDFTSYSLDLMASLFQNWRLWVEFGWAALKFVVGETWDEIKYQIESTLAGLRGIATGFMNAIGEGFRGIGTVAVAVATGVRQAWAGVFDGIGGAIAAIMSGDLAGAGRTFATFAGQGISNATATVGGAVTDMGVRMGNAFTDGVNAVPAVQRVAGAMTDEAWYEMEALWAQLDELEGEQRQRAEARLAQLAAPPAAAPAAVSTLVVEFAQSGLTDMWKKAQQSMTGATMEGLARAQLNAQQLQVQEQQNGNNLLRRANDLLGQPNPARAG